MKNEHSSEKALRCPLCLSDSIRLWRKKVVGGDTYEIDRCEVCRFAFVNPRPSWDFLNAYYNSKEKLPLTDEQAGQRLLELQEQERIYPNSRPDAIRMMETMRHYLGAGDVAPSLLDVGCGYGFYSKAALDSGFSVSALELGSDSRKITKLMTGLDAHACSFEAFEVSAGAYDALVMSHVLEHALDIHAWIKKANRLLADGGLLAVAIPNFGSVFRRIKQEREAFICPPEHVNYFDSSNLTLLLEQHGFHIRKVYWTSRKPGSHCFRSLAFKLLDTGRLGMMLTIFAIKVGERRRNVNP